MDDPTGLIDQPESWPVTSHEIKATGRVESFVEDKITTPSGEQITRQWASHPGAVAVMAMDDHGRIAVVHQYRHPVGFRLVEPPAGILDHAGESGLVAAQRELAEEARLQASDWRTLVDIFTSPGGLEESIRIYLARDLSPADLPDGFVIEGEEVDMGLYWMPLDDLVELVYQGKIQSPTLVSGTLSLALAQAQGRLDTLRSSEADWPARAVKEQRDRDFG
ncbi:NUDIX hydrolase [Propionimicrobium sp. PCR01-08-3]|uniref:NUDIX domain-containing protein n=1 Tax=Propionimicrobium sp. PCR01-08-3 TaxID=3052086 RepID=UPI00255CFC3C|nr:NUDIX hydrolase [Propionimicrobium sp. PCR01-08-3]WIY81841.1 NUDIX hydrolase [Propionimicrobium sp. PCR01-08-3]